MQNAEENIVVSAAGVEAAKYMKEKYGIPYRLGIPYTCEYVNKLIPESFRDKRMLIIGEGIDACSLTGRYGKLTDRFGCAVSNPDGTTVKDEGLKGSILTEFPDADILDIFGNAEEADYRTADEGEIRDIASSYEVIVADPCFKPLCGDAFFTARPTVSVSGGILLPNRG